jgi:hypothetical protein
MDDALLILRAGYAHTKATHPGPTLATVSAAAAATNTGADTGFVQLKNVDKIPYRGMALKLTFPDAITATGAGTTGTTLSFTVTFSDDGTNAVAGLSTVSRPISLTFASGALTAAAVGSKNISSPNAGFLAYLRLPEVRHKYIKVAWATSLGGSITATNYGKLGISIVPAPDSEPSNSYDIG